MIHESTVLDALTDVIDPELGINIVDLGLIYGIEIDEGGRKQGDIHSVYPDLSRLPCGGPYPERDCPRSRRSNRTSNRCNSCLEPSLGYGAYERSCPARTGLSDITFVNTIQGDCMELVIRDLHASIEDQPILRGIDLTVKNR